MDGIPLHPRRPGKNRPVNSRTTAEAVRAASRDVYPGWTIPQSDRDPGSVAERAIEAHITAATEGRKPLYYEPWGDDGVSKMFADAYREILPENVIVSHRNGFLYIYRPEIVRQILNSDPEFYRKTGESDFDSIARVSEAHLNGELLGYGARTMMERPAHEVKIFKGKHLVLYFFVSAADYQHASKVANERALDFSRAFDWRDVRYEILPRP